MAYVVAVDIGGTFTDLVAFDHDTQKVIYTKSPTTYGNFVEGILDCFAKAQIDPAIGEFLQSRHDAGHQFADPAPRRAHGTRHLGGIPRRARDRARQSARSFRSALSARRAADPARAAFRSAGALDAKGEIVTPLDVAALEKLAEELKRQKVDAVAVFFMNSYLDPSHEQRAAELLQRMLPGVYITCSTELTREWYEYERCSTAAANAYVGPQVNTYIRRLESDLTERGYDGSLFMMGSNGGLLSVARTCRQPIALVESGPIGGCIGAGAYAEALGIANVVAFDMGGTTAKCALVERGRFSVDSVYYANGYIKGFPIKSPVIDIVEVGSGGGSIIWLDEQKRLHVGPQSAGSTPGPVCYGRGGEAPTVTDANLVLGRLNADHFLGGELDARRRSRQARARRTRRDAARLYRRARRDRNGRWGARDRDRHHGRRDPPRLDRARARSARLRALLLWRRRAAACVGAGA